MDVQIVIQSDDGKERNEIYPADAPISIGRHPQCVVCLDSDLVSRQHAVVDVSVQSVRVEDLSTNGTLAGDKLLRRNAATYRPPRCSAPFSRARWHGGFSSS